MWMTQAAAKQNLLEDEQVMEGHDQKVMAWGSFGTRRPACLQTSWTKPKEEPSEEAVLLLLYPLCITSHWCHTLPLGLPQPWLLLPRRFPSCSWNVPGSVECLQRPKDKLTNEKLPLVENWSSTLKESNSTIYQQRHNFYSFVPFVVKRLLLPF